MVTQHNPDYYDVTVTECWRFENHPDQQAVLDANCYYLVESNDWWHWAYEHQKERWAEFGLTVDTEHMEFSGFYSQGDGACFTDCRIDWEKFWPQLTGKYWLLSGFKPYLPQPVITKRNHHYSHEYTVEIEFGTDYRDYNYLCDEILDTRGLYPPTEENARHRERCEARLLAELNALAQELTERLRREMRRLYQTLEIEYDDLTSDDALKTYFTEGEYLFEENGCLHCI